LWVVSRTGDFTTNRWIGATISLEGPQEPKHHRTCAAWFFKGREGYVQERVEAARKERERREAEAKKKGKSFDDGGISEKVSEPSAVAAQLDYYRRASEASLQATLEKLKEKANERNRNRRSERSGKRAKRINAATVFVKPFSTRQTPAGSGGLWGFTGKVTEKPAQAFKRDPGGRQGRKIGTLCRL